MLQKYVLSIFCAVVPLLTTSSHAAPYAQTVPQDLNLSAHNKPSLEARRDASLKSQLLGRAFDEDWIRGVYGENQLQSGPFDKELTGIKIDTSQQRSYVPDKPPVDKKGKTKFALPNSPPAMLANATKSSLRKILGGASNIRKFSVKKLMSTRGHTLIAKGFTNIKLGDKWALAEVSALKTVGLFVESGKLLTWPNEGIERPVILMNYPGKPLPQYSCYQALIDKGTQDNLELLAVVGAIHILVEQQLWELLTQGILHINFHIDNVFVSADEKCNVKAVQVIDWAYPNVVTTEVSITKDKNKFHTWFEKRRAALYFG
ncbi:hypothetical protein J3R30DRAFT_745722 [Lentinula aciculospora]|uniref:Protein kinase domain-containing protein n=1 Tax=Lentinula aciculospora TaxID=153920 RepID=A0A9W9A541_9AGAR|nr:hypothetical protein J3R30DRAFT_745722 [Lentinula aciculospora]